MDQNEFKFPHQQQEPEEGKEPVQAGADEEIVEIVDDAPEADRGRQPLGKTADEIAPDDEVGEYSEKVQKRIKEMKRAWHDERRAKEEQTRIAEEAVRTARFYYEQAQRSGQSAASTQKQAIEQMKVAAQTSLEAAEQELESAYESGDSKRVVKATKAVNEAQFKLARAQALENAPQFRQPAPLQQPQAGVQSTPTPPASQADTKALQWHKENQWYGSDEEMTSFAMGVHRKLVATGVVPDTDEYYAKLNKRMREVFPKEFADDADDDGGEGTPPPKDAKRPPATVVAPATRTSSAAPKLQISKSQAAIAAKLGVPVQEYARQVKLLMKQDQAKNG